MDASHRRQLIGSLAVAALIVIAAIVAVTLRFGPTSSAELEAAEAKRDARIEAAEERREAAEERREERTRP